ETGLEQLNLFFLGCLSYLSQLGNIRVFPTDESNQGILYQRIFDEKFHIDERCESESKIILNTFNRAFPFLENFIIEYSPLIICLCKIFEIEANLSLVHWFRKILGIEMPTYFKKHKEGIGEYKITPSIKVT
ncbi:MAG: hypothetical protein N2510_07760, partial [Ignavibacteria bacterium]|nr:hypothetical protein [Ignavibacteria bacterium]